MMTIIITGVAANGGSNPTIAYRQFVKAGLVDPIDPKIDRLKDWVYGSEEFLKQMLNMAAGEGEYDIVDEFAARP